MKENVLSRLAAEHPIVVGALGGLVWGAVLRAWMRYIAEFPEFSWSGTIFILGASAIAGTLTGLARHRRRVGGVGWWRLSLGSLLLLGAGGAVMWPAVVLLALAIGRPWRSPSRIVVGLAGLASQWPVLDGILNNWRLDSWESAIAVAWDLPMLAIEAWAFSVAFAPTPEATPVARGLRRAVIGFGVGGVAVVALTVVGFAG